MIGYLGEENIQWSFPGDFLTEEKVGAIRRQEDGEPKRLSDVNDKNEIKSTSFPSCGFRRRLPFPSPSAPRRSYLPATPTKMEIREERSSSMFMRVRGIRARSPKVLEVPTSRHGVSYEKLSEQVFCLRLQTTGQSRPIIEFREVGRRYSVKLKPGFLLLPPPPAINSAEGQRIGFLGKRKVRLASLRKGTRTMMTDTTVSIWGNFPFA
ncbi:hypothetical protein ALC56_10087 [Trachymyrmex septentrionalis]|uniref:Uncharacterized protein n=1 Tax=Trachymyrmex septentrionalis TaxID=34720 RepID=A0A195F4M1_9HYME|nr:hypothetical protein ALC56_10087 [Trachymyrmex septentrionalis]